MLLPQAWRRRGPAIFATKHPHDLVISRPGDDGRLCRDHRFAPDLPGVLLGAILFGLCAQCARYSVRFIAFMICVVAGPTSASMLLSERSAYVAAVTPTRSVGSEGGSSRL